VYDVYVVIEVHVVQAATMQQRTRKQTCADVADQCTVTDHCAVAVQSMFSAADYCSVADHSTRSVYVQM
jgi:hypothetical protein